MIRCSSGVNGEYPQIVGTSSDFSCSLGSSFHRLRQRSRRTRRLPEAQHAASDAFESGTVLPDHAYYYTGSEMNPNAIIAIYSDYTLETDRWKSVDATAKQLKDWVDMITDFRGYGLRTLGSDILGPHGEYIGIWYSKKSDFTTVRLLEGNRVMVFPPAENLIIPNPLRRLGVE